MVIDKGVNAHGNYAWNDGHPRIHFTTSYPTYFAQDMAATTLDRFEPADTAENRRHIEEGRKDECLLAYRTKGEYWGKERTVIVTHNPASAREQAYIFAANLEAMRQELLAMRAQVRDPRRTGETRRPCESGMFGFANNSIWRPTVRT